MRDKSWRWDKNAIFLQGRGPSFSSSSSPSHTLSMEQLSAEQLALWWPEGEIKPLPHTPPSPSLKPFNNPTLKPVRRGPTYSPLWHRPDRGPEHTTSQLSCSSRGYNNNIDIQISILIYLQAWQSFVKTISSMLTKIAKILVFEDVVKKFKLFSPISPRAQCLLTKVTLLSFHLEQQVSLEFQSIFWLLSQSIEKSAFNSTYYWRGWFA